MERASVYETEGYWFESSGAYFFLRSPCQFVTPNCNCMLKKNEPFDPVDGYYAVSIVSFSTVELASQFCQDCEKVTELDAEVLEDDTQVAVCSDDHGDSMQNLVLNAQAQGATLEWGRIGLL